MKPSRIAVIGAGPVGCATLAYLSSAGHDAVLWSPTLQRVRTATGRARIATTGALAVDFEPQLLDSPDELASFDHWIVCLPANAYESVLGELAAFWRDGHTVIVSGALALSPLWLQEMAAERGLCITAAGWNTTLTTTHFNADGTLHVNPLRERIEVSGVGTAASKEVSTLCAHWLGNRFTPASSLMAITLGNINPIAHAAEVLPNLSRMDRGEQWSLFGCFTPVVAQIAEALDLERLAVARAFDLEMPTLREHYARSYHVTPGTLDAMAAEIVERGMSPNGPAQLAHRYVLEDGPFGMAFLEALGRMCAVPTPVLSACITLLEASYGRDLRGENFLTERLALDSSTPAGLQARCAAARSASTAGQRALRAR